MDQDQGFSVLLEHRPRCVAFLVDLDSANNDLINEIVGFNVDSWGGRFNPIIPTQHKRICPDYWRLLKLSDADVIYSYSELEQETLERLDRECGPIFMVGSQKLRADERPNYWPYSLDDQVSVQGLLLRLRGLLPPIYRQRRETSILTFDMDHIKEDEISDFVRRNFGVSRKAFYLARDEGVNATYPNSPSDGDVIKCIEETPNLLLPINLSALGSRRRKAILGDKEEPFLICYGDHVANAIYYWNRAYFRDLPYLWASGINDMWIGTSSIADAAMYQAVLRVIRALGSSGGMRELKVVSCDHEALELDALATKICADIKTNFYAGRSERLSPDFFPEIPIVRSLGHDAGRVAHEFVRGRRFFVPVERPEDVAPERDKHWMMRLWVDNPRQEKLFVNEEPWWQVPHRQTLASLFAGPYRRCRVGMNGELVFEVGSHEETCEVTIPEKHSLFSSLLLPGRGYWTVGDLRHAFVGSHDSAFIQPSEKNKYLNGLLNLFGSVREATKYFEHPFWAPTLIRLCRAEVSQQVRDQVRARIRKEAPAFITEFQRDEHAAVEWLIEEIIAAGQKIPRSETILHFEELVESHKKFVEGLKLDWERDVASEMDLKRDLFGLAQSGVLLQGFEIKCEHCMSRFWYHVDDVTVVIRCVGCRQEIPLPVEKRWSYKPNELLWRSIRDYGLVPVIRTIRRLFDESKHSFIFASGVAFYDHKDEREVLTQELDLAWIKDTEFGIAEVKQSTSWFRTKDCERLISIAGRARPNKVLLVAVEGEDAKMAKWQQVVDSALKPLGIITEAWGPSVFATPDHRSW